MLESISSLLQRKCFGMRTFISMEKQHIRNKFPNRTCLIKCFKKCFTKGRHSSVFCFCSKTFFFVAVAANTFALKKIEEKENAFNFKPGFLVFNLCKFSVILALGHIVQFANLLFTSAMNRWWM